MEQNQNRIKKLKVLIIGDSAVGKTALLTRFVDKKFSEKYIPTLGVDFRVTKAFLNNEEYQIQLWDTAGQERFRTISRTFFRGADGVVICFDLSNEISLINLRIWLQMMTVEFEQGTISMVLAGTKADLPVKLDEKLLQKYLDEYQIHYFVTSSKSGLNVDETFDFLINQIKIRMDSFQSSESSPGESLKRRTDEEEQKNNNEKVARNKSFSLRKSEIKNQESSCSC